MREYKLWHLGAEYKIISLNDGEDIPKRLGRGIALVPDKAENYDLTALDIGSDTVTGKEAKGVLEIYFSQLCGYPKCELDIMLFGKHERIIISDEKSAKKVIKPNKCKQIYTNAIVMNDLTELKLTTIEYENIRVRIYECHDIEGCGADLNKRILFAPGLIPADVSLILSKKGEMISYPSGYEGELIDRALADYFNLSADNQK